MNSEIRIDPLSGLKTVVAAKRATRPGSSFTVEEPRELDRSSDPFAEGNEHLTPAEVYAVRPGSGPANSPGWLTRVVPNLYPALTVDNGERPARYADQELFQVLPGHGNHEVIINSPSTATTLVQLDLNQLTVAMETWRSRMQHHAAAAYVHLIVNEGRMAGASLPHTHAQLYALNFVPATVARERERFSAYAVEKMGSNLLADLVQAEVRLGERIVAVDGEAVLLAPYASRVPYQLMLVPRKATPQFELTGPLGAELLHKGLRALERHLGASPPLNLWIRTAPQGAEHFCWRIDILPRLTHLAGLELGIGVPMNIVTPETVASELRAVIAAI